MSDTALKQAILFFGAVSYFLGKKVLDGAGPDRSAENDPVVRALRKAGA
jgi:hypothetical protein